MNANIGLTTTECSKLKSVLAAHPNVSRAIVYGSRAKGTNRRFSDVDMTLVGSSLALRDLNIIAQDIDDLLLPYEFDLSLYSSLKNEALIDHIKRVGVVIYDSETSK